MFKPFINILFLIVLLSVAISSCVKDQGEFEASLSIVSLINPDEPFQVSINKTAPALGSHVDLEIKDAEVYIINNETQEVSLLSHTNNGIYISNGTKPIPGYDYEIQVRAPGFEQAFSTTYVPEIDIDVNVPENQSGNEELTFSFSANMSVGNSKQYFAYELIYSGLEVIELEEEPELPQNAPLIETTKVSTLLPIAGEVTDGSTTTVMGETIKTPKGEIADIKDVSVRIVAVSRQYYDYLVIEQNPEDVHYSSIYFKDSKVFSNFVGGAYGIFGGLNDRTIKLSE